MGTIFCCCFKKPQKQPDPLSIEEEYNTLPSGNDEEYYRIKNIINNWYDRKTDTLTKKQNDKNKRSESRNPEPVMKNNPIESKINCEEELRRYNDSEIK